MNEFSGWFTDTAITEITLQTGPEYKKISVLELGAWNRFATDINTMTLLPFVGFTEHLLMVLLNCNRIERYIQTSSSMTSPIK